MSTRLEKFDYSLPPELIAQEPCSPRDRCRMMVLNRKTGSREEKLFHNLPDHLEEGDVLVVNNSLVIPARLYGRKDTGAKIEVLLLRKPEQDQKTIWEVLVRPGKRIRAGMRIYFKGGANALIRGRVSEKKWIAEFETEEDFEKFLDKNGATPLPPYIRRGVPADYEKDRQKYQTVYARVPGSVAAPTAGLHFTADVLSALKNRGVEVVQSTLHVGYGTFLPVETEFVEDHQMEGEYYEIGKEACDRINHGKRVIAAGTTSTRVLESASDENGVVKPGSGWTQLYIYPGYCFKRTDGLLTNFHLPKSSLFLLVSAFAGGEFIREAYAEAISRKFRFYSYGDCMLIL